ncbi:hypothetical protein HNQ80_001104 [Anaerosolibacter carboniphilus]|uniref:Uncharacterized protein n=1 Tax=Anaerosolibacter carboniphilus TaxID=1417629 RepID=A0A841KY09_9FIRM|nr:hypothetical protein [Anaerosolibacter carboniphilus]MBB6215015.1 hypothetical protein [Anaerosolibacter carboniphilus]
MAGIHTVYRKTNLKNVVAAFSRLVLPASGDYGCQENDSNYKNGAFPEFFHGFYDNGNGFDAGVLYSGGKWRAFVSFTGSTPWADSPTGFTVPANREIAIRTYLSGDYLILQIQNSTGEEIDKVHYYLPAQFKTLMQNGAEFNREMTIGVNKNAQGIVTAPKDAYYKDATFKNTSITVLDGTTQKLSTSNSNVTNSGKVDPGTPTNTYADRKSSTTVDGFVHDNSSATFNKTVYPV